MNSYGILSTCCPHIFKFVFAMFSYRNIFIYSSKGKLFMLCNRPLSTNSTMREKKQVIEKQGLQNRV